MKPTSSRPDPQDDLFKVRLSDLVDPEHKLCRLARRIDWEELEQVINLYFSEVGAPAPPVRLMVGLLYLQHAYQVSDEAVVEHWVESPFARSVRTSASCCGGSFGLGRCSSHADQNSA